jgi:DNA-binding CsgD family transcriptional regulator
MPADLTPTDERILGYIAQGLHDAEIGVRVGLPVGDVKARVTSLMQRERLLDRAALVEWYRGPAEPVGSARGTPPRMLRDRRWFAPLVGVGAFVAGAGLMAALTWPSSDDPGAAAGPEPTSTASPTAASQLPAATLTLNPTLVPRPFSGNATTIDAGFAPIVINWAGGRTSLPPAATIDRLYLDPVTGALMRETVWEQQAGTFLETAITNDLGTLLAIQYSDQDSTWLQVMTLGGRVLSRDELDGELRPAFFAGGTDLVLVSCCPPTSQPYSPGGLPYQNIAPPATATGPPIGWSPQDGLLWPGPDGEVTTGGPDGQGTRFRLAIQALVALGVETFGLMRDDGLDGESRIQGGGFGSGLAIPAVSIDEGLALINWDAGDRRLFTSLVGLGRGVVIASWEGEFKALGTATGARFVGHHCFEQRYCPGGQPAVYEVRDRRLRELAGIGEDERLIGAQRGPFVRVVAGSTARDTPPVDCEPIYSGAPGGGPGWCADVGEPLTLADLLPTNEFDQGTPQGQTFDGVAYVRVLTPLGYPGWIRVDAVEGLETEPAQ